MKNKKQSFYIIKFYSIIRIADDCVKLILRSDYDADNKKVFL